MKFFFALIAAIMLAGTVLAQTTPQRRQGGFLNNRRGQVQQQQQQVAGDENGRPPLATREDMKNVPKGTNGVPALAFNQTPLELVLEAYAEQVQKTVLPAPDLPKATITLRSLEGQMLTKDDYLFAIEHVLTMNGVVLEERGEKFLRALARKTVRTQGIPLLMHNKGLLPEKGRVVSQLISFQNITVAEAQKALEGFKDPTGLFQVFERTNAILVTDTQENINRMIEIAKAIDIATPVLEDVFVRQIKFAVANDIKTALETIVTESQKENQNKEVGPKTSGAPGFGSRQPPTIGSRLLNLNNRPGAQQQPEPPKANDPMIASVSDADRGMIRGKVLILADERSNKLIVITMKSNMDFFDRVIETLDVETEPEFKVEVVRLKYAEAEDVESMLNDLIGGTSSSSNKENKNQNAKTAANTKQNITQGNKPAAGGGTSAKGNVHQGSVGDLNKDNCKVLADKRINGIVVMTRKELMPIIMKVIDDMDVRLSQVLLETVIVQIELGDDLQTGVDWIKQNKHKTYSTEQATDSYGRNLFYTTRNTIDSSGKITKTELVSKAVPEGYSETWTDGGNTYEESASSVKVMKTVVSTVRNAFFADGDMVGGGGGSGSSTLKSYTGIGESMSDKISAMKAAGIDTSSMSSSELTAMAAAFSTGAANPIGGGINYFLTSKKLDLSAIIQASKSDSKSKVLASPILMTVDNKEATIEATDMIYLFSGYQYSGSTYSGTQVRNYEKRDIGLTVKVTPKINPNGTVMLTIEETFETQGADQNVPNESGGTDPYATVTTRKMSSDISVENRQTIVMGGLTKKTNVDSESGIPILKDIPYIGKWLFGTVTHKEARSELLVFITPYVLDDAEASQAEALRRKKSLSDPRPWEDDGWSASPLADPVSKRTQLRRFQEEWKKQDEERKTKLAIEKAKVDRAKKLEKMTKDEREFWINLHKEELEKEEREAFEKQVEEQKDLKEFVETLKKPKIENAEKAIKENEKSLQSDNEYHKTLREMNESGKPLPAGETLKRDAMELEGEKAKVESPQPPKAVNVPKADNGGESANLLRDLKQAKN